ncbi:MAG: excinuclease ABC subunit UvrA [Caldiserica bacterium]|jgi:excinuclease ABC subunit A|nr:excinuclease ABC subunit UvrA [Caldisericota bacterium]MDH7562731.1 excinuclease ABC subunit UvrA [Caldisericota bacterium]
MNKHIFIKGAREHNLKNIDLEIPRDRLVVITGISGSGKSSLAFDTLYAEGQRRYVESLSAYARQFLGLMEKPDVDYIEGLSPAIAIDQRSASHNPRSTVGTITEIYDYLRLLYARIATPFCPNCGHKIERQTLQQIVDFLLSSYSGRRVEVFAPIVRGKKGEFRSLLEDIRKQGFVRARVDGKVYDLSEEIPLGRYEQHSIEIIVDRLVIKEEIRMRLTDSIETALKLAQGLVLISSEGEERIFSEKFSCPECGTSIAEVTPRLFSFNSPYGACPTCDGLGVKKEIDPDKVIVDRNLSISEGAIEVWESDYHYQMLRSLVEDFGYTTHTPISQMDPQVVNMILYGTKEKRVTFRYTDPLGREHVSRMPFEGIIPNLERRYRQSESQAVREEIESFMTATLCPTCQGKRLKKEALSFFINGLNISQLTEMTIKEAFEFFEKLELPPKEALISHQILKEIKSRLRFLLDVGLSYLSLDRPAETLAGGEAQRLRLATQVGSGLVGVLYVLDEPSIGLHPRDNSRLLNTLKRLRDLGNTVVVVEHDEQTIRAADYLIDIGPGAGVHGGFVVCSGSLEDILREPNSLTGKYLKRELTIPVPSNRRKGSGKWLWIKGAREHNLKDIDVGFPLGTFICVTGVSGSGKSTLVNDILFRALARKFYRYKERPGAFRAIEGVENLDKVIIVDQSPIGRTPRSNPATYIGVFDHIRDFYSQLPEARVRGYQKGRFSFNVRGGRCEACRGEGIIRIEMVFLPDVYVPCDVCKGRRYNRETLEVKYRGKSIADVLDMTVEEALEFFQNIPPIRRKLQLLSDVGLGYIRLGQPATTLSGGEAQRIKLTAELSKRDTGRTLYILDEPTTGLHFADVQRLLDVLNRLVDAQNTVIVIEHNLDVIKCADWIIDLGPEGGDEGGRVIFTGTPEEIVSCKDSYTGQFLKEFLNPEREKVHA